MRVPRRRRQTASSARPVLAGRTAKDYGGVDTYQSRGGVLTGVADSKKFVYSDWFNPEGGNGTERALLTIGTNTGAADDKFSVVLTAANKLRVIGKDAAGNSLLFKLTNPTYQAGSGWHHVMASIDLGTVGVSWLRVDGVLVALDTNVMDDGLIRFAGAGVWNHAGYAATARWHGCKSEVFFHEGVFLDDTAANLAKFRNADGTPATLGDNGELPLGVQPRIYGPSGDLSGAGARTGNKGTGGAFFTQGANKLTACERAPTP